MSSVFSRDSEQAAAAGRAAEPFFSISLYSIKFCAELAIPMHDGRFWAKNAISSSH